MVEPSPRSWRSPGPAALHGATPHSDRGQAMEPLFGEEVLREGLRYAWGEESTARQKKRPTVQRVTRPPCVRQDCLRGRAPGPVRKLRVFAAFPLCSGQVGTGPTYLFVVL